MYSIIPIQPVVSIFSSNAPFQLHTELVEFSFLKKASNAKKRCVTIKEFVFFKFSNAVEEDQNASGPGEDSFPQRRPNIDPKMSNWSFK